MVSPNDAAYKYVQQANKKEAIRKLPSGYEERKRNRTSKGVVIHLIWRWVFWAGMFVMISGVGTGEMNWKSLFFPLFALIETIAHYPEWSRKRKAEKSS